MDFYTDLLTMALEHGLVYIGMAFVAASIGLFIYDGIKAKKEKRKRKIWITIMFIISVILMVLSVLSVIFIVGCMVYYVLNS
ncbi:MAG: hypothetical protein J5685_00280 [Clostridiales bacterium]|nr:hypothetical protein [Clostridiales bacterium]